MAMKKILTIQDISCFGQCSTTVALPVLSAFGLETCILPSAILSTHTAGFKDFFCFDLTKQMPLILNHWKRENLKFDLIYTGYLGSCLHFDYVESVWRMNLVENCFKLVVDPVMADDGRLYSAFNKNYVEKMKVLVSKSDIILPNVTEACFLTDTVYSENYDELFIDNLLLKLQELGAKNVVLTGVSFSPDTIGVFVSSRNCKHYYEHRKLNFNLHGTGDLFSSAFVGSFSNGVAVFDSAKLAANFVVRCMENTSVDLKNHWWGAKFEPELFWLINQFKKLQNLN